MGINDKCRISYNEIGRWENWTKDIKKTISAVNWFVPFVSVSVNSEAHEISMLTESFLHVHVFCVCLIVSKDFGTYFSNVLLIETERKPQRPFLKRSTE